MAIIRLPRIQWLYDLPVGLGQFLDEIPVGIVVMDTDHRIILLNRACQALTGYVTEDVRGVPCRYILRSNICLHDCPLKHASGDLEAVCVEANIINRTRQKIPVRVTSAPVQDLVGGVAGFVETVEDIRFVQDRADKTDSPIRFANFIGRSPEIQNVFRLLPVVAQTDSSVLITGQTGTGKDFVAEAIHQASDRAKGPFVKVNCGAVPETLLESELFGHEKGAFTGAVSSKPGRFRLAQNGTLYLTEIGDLPLSLQVKLLSFLDDKVVYPLGSSKGHHVDVRVIAATHRNLEQMVREGKFREDLLFRLNVVRIQLPPVSARGDDVKMLLDHFLKTFNSRFKKGIKGFSSQAHETLLVYRYPGNVRELRNIVEYAVNICDGEMINPEHLPSYVTESPVEPEGMAEPVGILQAHERRILLPGPNDGDWETVERRMIMDAMMKAGGRRNKAAAILGWGRSTLWRKLKRYGISSR